MKRQLVTGENCEACLQLHFDPSAKKYCVGNIINITVSTNQSYTLSDAIILMVNDKVCSGNNSIDDIVECDKSDDCIGNSCSFILTAINNGTIIIKAHTNYFGADLCSESIDITIMQECTESTYVCV